MKRFKVAITRNYLIRILFLLMAWSGSSVQALESHEHFKIAGGDIQSFSIGLSGLMCQIMSHDKNQCKTEVTTGNLENILRVQSQEYDFSIVPEYTLDKFFYSNKNDYSKKNIQRVMALGQLYFYIVVQMDSGIEGIGDLKMKSISIEPGDQMCSAVVDELLSAHGLEKNKNVMVYKAQRLRTAIPKFCAQKYNALAFMDTNPSFFLALINKSCSAKILKISSEDLTKLSEKNKDFELVHFNGQEEFNGDSGIDMALSTPLILIVNNALSGKFVFELLKEIEENFFFITAYHPSLKNLKFEDSFNDPSIPVHIGVNWFLQSIKHHQEKKNGVPISQSLDADSDKEITNKESKKDEKKNQNNSKELADSTLEKEKNE